MKKTVTTGIGQSSAEFIIIRREIAILKTYFILPQLFVFFFDVFGVAVFVIRDICKKEEKKEADLCLNLCV